MAKAMDQEACWSCDHSGKPSTQWALIPGTQFGESTPREKRTQRHPYPPVRDLEVPLRGVGSTEKGERPICLFAQKPLRDALLSVMCLPWEGALPHTPTTLGGTLQPPAVTSSARPRAFSNMLPQQLLHSPRLQ